MRRPTPVQLAVGVAAIAIAACSGSGSGSGTEAPSGPQADQADQADQAEPAEEAIPGRWREGAEAAESMWRTEVGGAAYEGELWVAGGFAGPDGRRVADVSIYDPVLDQWSAGPELPEALDHTALVGGDRLYVLGGYGEAGPTDAVWVLDEASRTWIAGPPLPAPRAAGAAAWDGARVVYGGGLADRAGTVADEVFALEDGQWRTIGDLDVPRDHLAAASDGQGRVWFLAGRQGSIETNQSVVELVEDDRISTIGGLPIARGGIAGFHLPEVGGCAAGGEAANTYRRVECIDADGTVRALPDLAQPRHGIGAGVVEGVVYVLLGGPRPAFSFSGTVQILELDASAS